MHSSMCFDDSCKQYIKIMYTYIRIIICTTTPTPLSKPTRAPPWGAFASFDFALRIVQHVAAVFPVRLHIQYTPEITFVTKWANQTKVTTNTQSRHSQ